MSCDKSFRYAIFSPFFSFLSNFLQLFSFSIWIILFSIDMPSSSICNMCAPSVVNTVTYRSLLLFPIWVQANTQWSREKTATPLHSSKSTAMRWDALQELVHALDRKPRCTRCKRSSGTNSWAPRPITIDMTPLPLSLAWTPKGWSRSKSIIDGLKITASQPPRLVRITNCCKKKQISLWGSYWEETSA